MSQKKSFYYYYFDWYDRIYWYLLGSWALAVILIPSFVQFITLVWEGGISFGVKKINYFGMTFVKCISLLDMGL